MEKQVNAAHYEFRKYVSKERWNSFYRQIDEIALTAPDTVLEIGVGSGVLKTALKEIVRLNYESIDIDGELGPDHVGSVTDLPFSDNRYDTVACFQVLEHLPYENFERALSEMFRVAKKAVIISLPNSGKTFKVHIPKICRLKLFKNPFAKTEKHSFDGEHYWEINKKGYGLKKIILTIDNVGAKYNFKLTRQYRVWEYPYHHFFVLTRQNCE